MSGALITGDAIDAVIARMAGFVRETPVVAVAAAEFDLAGQPVLLKLENLQAGGSFKARGAFANLLSRDVPMRGVAAAAAGNHGVAVALAAARLGARARLFVPDVVPKAKRARMRAMGAEICITAGTLDAAIAMSRAWAAMHGALTIHPYDSRETLIGNATIGVELVRQAPLDTVLVPVGGGGLAAGIASALGPRMRIVAVEPTRAPTLSRAIAAGGPVTVDVSGIAADGLGVGRIGSFVLPLLKRTLAASVLVTDADIRAAQQRLWAVARIAAEPAGATALAALTSGAYVPRRDERVAVVVTGANAAVDELMI